MAQLDIDGMENVARKLNQLEGAGMRQAIKRIVTAGAEAEARAMEEQTRSAGHVRKGSMAEEIRGSEYRETMGGGEISVYPQGTDEKGVRNAMKAYVINYGRGRRRTARTGDKFITGKGPAKQAEAAVSAAMQAEAVKIFQEMGLSE